MAEVLIAGAAGGREAALQQAMAASPEVTRAIVSADIQAGLDEFSESAEKPFVIIGPEAPLVKGAADKLRAEGYTVLGAGEDAAQYEASKARTTKLARQAHVWVPSTYIAEGPNMASHALGYVEHREPETYVIKADGLAGGKGVVLPETREEAEEVVRGMISGELFDAAGSEIINFQERMKGPEVSWMVVVGGGKDDFTVLPLTQDHKRLGEGDTGPNTGGMGAFGPVSEALVTPERYAKMHDNIYRLLAQAEKNGVDYSGAVLYAGTMIPEEEVEGHENDSVLIEINVRFGDPETQAIFPLLQHLGVDSYRFLRSAAEGETEVPAVNMQRVGAAALTVCLAAPGYPEKPVKGTEIHGLDKEYPGASIQLAGVERDGDTVRTAGGRVLYVTGVGANIDDAAARAYSAIGENGVHFDGNVYRRDIGHQFRKAT